MRRSGIGSGGGYGVNKQKDVRAPNKEPVVHGIRPAHVGQIGTALGDHVTEHGKPARRAFEPRNTGGYTPPVGPTDNVAACGVGGGRKVYRSGSQATQGPVSGSAKPDLGPILSTFGPDYKGSRR
jgi:hypothetical protein